MATEMGQSQRIEQGLAITPQLKRSLEILQAPTLDLHDMIVNELQTNPILEEISPAEIPEKPESVGENPDDFDGEDLQPSQNNQSDEQLKRDFVLNSIPDTQSLREYLLNESKLDAENARVAEAFEALVGAMDDRGFLDADAVENAVSKGFDEKIVRQALDMLRNSSPSGIGAFDIRDSLMLQLEHKHMGNSLAYKILEDHFDLLLKRRVNEIAEIENRTVEDVENAISEIAKLSTSPAIDFAEDTERYITPDIVYKKENQAWTAELTNEYIPKLRINPEYRQMIAEGKLRKDAESYVKEKNTRRQIVYGGSRTKAKYPSKNRPRHTFKAARFFRIRRRSLAPHDNAGRSRHSPTASNYSRTRRIRKIRRDPAWIISHEILFQQRIQQFLRRLHSKRFREGKNTRHRVFRTAAKAL